MTATRTVSTVTTLHGKSTFAFDAVKRRAIKYLQKTNQEHQIGRLPESYPQHRYSLNGIDASVLTKILKAHLEDAYPQNIFSVSLTRRKEHSVISITCDMSRPEIISEMISEIISLYENDTTKISLDTFVYNTCKQ